jgi:Zn-dependent protease with chaperone function
MKLSGHLIPEKSTKRHAGALLVGEPGQPPNALWLAAGEAPAIAVHIVHVSTPISGADCRINLGGEGVFILPQDRFPPALMKFLPAKKSRLPFWLHTAEQMKWRSMTLVLALIVSAIFGVRAGMPVFADRLAAHIPQSWQKSLGEITLGQLDQFFLEPSRLPPVQRRAVEREFTAILAQLPADKSAITLHFRHAPDIGPNAFAIPGGNIIILDSLVSFLDGNPDALTGVMAHEVGHVVKRHAMRTVTRTTLTAIAAALIFGADESFIEEIAASGATMAIAEQSRGHELEADQFSASIMRDMGRDPASLIQFFDSLQEACGQNCDANGILSSHPSFRQRRNAIQPGHD